MDRLSSLISRFRMRVNIASPSEANLLVLASPEGAAEAVLFCAQAPLLPPRDGVCLALRVEWAGSHNL